MIQGIKIHVSAKELKEHLLDKVQYHKKKADFYKNKVNALEEAEKDEPMTYATSDPTKQVADKQRSHQGKSEYFKFLADHIVPDETYELSEQDLTRLQIISYYY